MTQQKERVALVTGAAGGIGSAIAARLAHDGFRVACSDRAAADAERAASGIEGAAGFGCDLRSEHAVAELRDVVTAELGAPWLLVNAAGVFFEHEITELSIEQWDQVMDVNVRGTFLTCRALLPAMQEAGSGCVVNIASTAGLSGGHTRAAYNASKGAVVLFTRSLAIDWGPRGVRVNCVCPGLIDTPMADWIRLDAVRLAAFERSLPAQRIGTPEDVADAVVVPGLGRRVVPARQYAGRRWRGHRLSEGLVTSVHNQFVVVRMGGEERESTIAGRLRRARPVVGDRVEIRELPDRSVRVEAVLPRRGILLRGAFRNEEKIVAANVDVLVIVAAVADPPLRTGLIDRYLVAAWRGGDRGR